MKRELESGSLSWAIAHHVATAPFSSLPAATIASTKRALVDGLGVMLAASGLSTDILPFIDLARSMGVGQASILGFDERVAPSAAAFANGAMAHALDYEDSFDAAPCHPNAALLPAALAIAETHGPVTGQEFLTAIAVGCDLTCRLALSLKRPMEAGGWYPPPILGAFGATAAAGRLLKLDPRQMLDAFSLILCQTTCPGEIKYSADTVIRAVREAFAAHGAVISALLARNGVRGFNAPFEGKAGFFRLYAEGQFDETVLRNRLGSHYWIEALSFKRWPACRGTHAYIEAAQTLRAHADFRLDAVEAIILTGGEVHRMLIEPANTKKAPTTIIDAKFSLPFTVAATLVHGDVTLASFGPDQLSDPQVLALAARVHFAERPDWSRDRAASGGVELIMRDGTRPSIMVELAMGHPDRPLADSAILTKFLACTALAARPVERETALRLYEEINKIEQAKNVTVILPVHRVLPD